MTDINYTTWLAQNGYTRDTAVDGFAATGLDLFGFADNFDYIRDNWDVDAPETTVFYDVLRALETASAGGAEVVIEGDRVDFASFGYDAEFKVADFDISATDDAAALASIALLHFARNIAQPEGVTYADIIQGAGLEGSAFRKVTASKNLFHTIDDAGAGITGNAGNVKWISSDGRDEYIFRPGVDGYELVLDAINKGSYNYASLADGWAHVRLDVDPWRFFGNTMDDPTTQAERGNLASDTVNAVRSLGTFEPDIDPLLALSVPDATGKLEVANPASETTFYYRYEGDARDNLIISGPGADDVRGGAGTDTVSYVRGTSAVSVNLGAGLAFDGPGSRADQGRDNEFWDKYETLDSIENVTGTIYGDVIWADGGDNRLEGLAGADQIFGRTGDDTLDGGAGNDTLEGGFGDDSVLGGAGDDLITAGAGADTLDGGTGTDTLSYANSAAGVVVDLTTGTGTGGDAQGDRISGIEVLLGSDQNDDLTGGTQATTLSGGRGNDTLRQGAGADTLEGGSGSDRFVLSGGTVAQIADYFGVSGTGDVIDVSAYVSAAFAAGQEAAQLVRTGLSGQTTFVEVNRDGTGATHGWQRVAELDVTSGTALRYVLAQGGTTPDAVQYASGNLDAWVFDRHSAYTLEDAGTLTFTLNRPEAETAQTVYVSTVDVMASRGVVNENDYVALDHQPVTFAAGQTSAQVQLTILDDALQEPNQTVGLVVQAAQSPVTSLYQATHLAWTTVQIYDPQDVAPDISDLWATGTFANTVAGSTDARRIIGDQVAVDLLTLDFSGTPVSGLATEETLRLALSWPYNKGGLVLSPTGAATETMNFDYFDAYAITGTGLKDFINLAQKRDPLGDYISTGAGSDDVRGGDGNDTIFAGDDRDLVYANDGDDQIYAGDGNDFVRAGEGHDTVYGGAGDDQIYADGTLQDSVAGEAGNDWIISGSGGILADGGTGIDLLDLSAVDLGDADQVIDLRGGRVTTLSDGTQFENVEYVNVALGAGDDVVFVDEDTSERLDTHNLPVAFRQSVMDLGAGLDVASFDLGQAVEGLSVYRTADWIQVAGWRLRDVETLSVQTGGGNDFVQGNVQPGDVQTDLLERLSVATHGGSDTFAPIALRNFFDAGSGDDRLASGTGDVEFFAGSGADQMSDSSGQTVLYGQDGDDTFFAEMGQTTIQGGAGRDFLSTGSFADRDNPLPALEAEVTVDAEGQLSYADDRAQIYATGLETLRSFGSAGNDVVSVSLQKDAYIDLRMGAGTDMVEVDLSGYDDGAYYFGHDAGLSVFLGPLTSQDYLRANDVEAVRAVFGGGNDIVDGSALEESFDTGSGDDRIDAGGGDDLIISGAGNDTVFGGEGDDVLRVDMASTQTYVVAEPAEGYLTLVSDTGRDRIHADVETITFTDRSYTYAELAARTAREVQGTDNAENVTGTDAADVIFAGGGADWITPGAGSDIIDGGEGRDMVSFVSLTDTPGRPVTTYRLTLDLGAGTGTTSDGDTYVLRSIERVTGTVNEDYIRGSATRDELRTGGAYDWIVATTGADHYDGGQGSDMVSYLEYTNTRIASGDVFGDGSPLTGAAVTGVVVDLADNANNTGLAAGHTYAGIERITGSSREDVFWGDGAENDFRGAGGYDWFVGSTGGRERYFGGTGVDTVTYFNAEAGVTASLRGGAVVNGAETGRGSAGIAAGDLYFEIENLIGTAYADHLTGNSGRNALNGLAGDDMLFGFAGADTLKGGAGNDTIDGGGGSDTALFDGVLDDFVLTKLDRSTVTVTGADGTDELFDVEYFQFDDQQVTIWELSL